MFSKQFDDSPVRQWTLFFPGKREEAELDFMEKFRVDPQALVRYCGFEQTAFQVCEVESLAEETTRFRSAPWITGEAGSAVFYGLRNSMPEGFTVDEDDGESEVKFLCDYLNLSHVYVHVNNLDDLPEEEKTKMDFFEEDEAWDMADASDDLSLDQEV
jgi:hypothetical protein